MSDCFNHRRTVATLLREKDAITDECDRLKVELEKFKAPHFAVVKLETEVEMLKVELEDEQRYARVRQKVCEELQAKRDLWKSKAERLAEALQLCANTNLVSFIHKIATEALADYEKGE